MVQVRALTEPVVAVDPDDPTPIHAQLDRVSQGSQAAWNPRANVVGLAILGVCIAAGILLTVATDNPAPVIVLVLVGLALMQAPKIANQWERAVVLRLGRFHVMRGPGLFW